MTDWTIDQNGRTFYKATHPTPQNNGIQNKDKDRTMLQGNPQNPQGIGSIFRDRMDAATPRVLTTQIVAILRDPVINAISQMGGIRAARRQVIRDFLTTPQGDALFRAGLSVLTPVIPVIPEAARAALTRELQVSSLATFGDFVASVITAPVAGLLGGLFAAQETASKLGGQAQGVEVEPRTHG